MKKLGYQIQICRIPIHVFSNICLAKFTYLSFFCGIENLGYFLRITEDVSGWMIWMLELIVTHWCNKISFWWCICSWLRGVSMWERKWGCYWLIERKLGSLRHLPLNENITVNFIYIQHFSSGILKTMAGWENDQ